MCSSCGKRAAALRKPGATNRNPLVLGAENGAVAQPATFQRDSGIYQAQEYVYVTGTGVDASVEDGTIVLGLRTPTPRAKTRKPPGTLDEVSEFFVRRAEGVYRGFADYGRAQRYALVVGGEVLSREQASDDYKKGSS